MKTRVMLPPRLTLSPFYIGDTTFLFLLNKYNGVLMALNHAAASFRLRFFYL